MSLFPLNSFVSGFLSRKIWEMIKKYRNYSKCKYEKIILLDMEMSEVKLPICMSVCEV